MKTKYSTVVKVKKEALNKAESNLNVALSRQAQHEEALTEANKVCESLNLPLKGGASELRESMKLREVARETRDRAAEKVLLSQKEVAHYQHLYKRANLDYEKVKYLEAQELKKLKKELEKIEAKNLDEIAISRFFRSHHDEEI